MRMPVAELDMYFVVATLTQTHQVTFRVGSTATHWDDVMDFLDRRELTFLQAAFAQRMEFNVTFPDSSPVPAILLVVVRRS